MLTAHHHFPAASTSNPGSPTFPHSQSLSLNGAGFALALRPGTSVGHRAPERESSLASPLPEDPVASPGSGRTYLDFVRSWDDDQVGRWLGEVGVGQHQETFCKNDIRGNVLLDVDQSALKEMGVRSVGDRIKITVAIKALRQRCAASVRSERLMSRVSTPSLNSARGITPSSNGTVASPPGMASGVRRAGSGRGSGRIPPPLHLTQSNSVPASDLPKAWQPSTTSSIAPRPSWGSQSGYTTLGPFANVAASPRASGSPRSAHPPALPPPSFRLPAPPAHRPSTSPPASTMSPPRVGAPSISTTAASPTNSYVGSSGSGSNWTGEYGLPRAPAPGNLAGGAYTARTSSSSPSAIDRARGPSVTVNTSLRHAASTATAQHRKNGSGGNAPRPSTTQAVYGHNAPLSSHPYATASSPTQDGFSVTTYGRGSPNLAPSAASSTAKLLPSPSIGQAALSPASEGSDGPRSSSSGSPSTGSSLSSPVPISGYRSYPRSNSTPATSLTTTSPASSLDAVMRKAVKFISEDGGSKMVAVADCSDGREVLLRVLKKFQKLAGGPEGDDLEGWGVYSMSSDGQTAHLLSEDELFAICRNAEAPERQPGLGVRRIQNPSKRGRKLQWVFGESNTPDTTRPGGVTGSSPPSPNYLGVEIPSTTIEPASPSASSSSGGSDRGIAISERSKRNRASVVSVMSGLSGDWMSSTTHLDAAPPLPGDRRPSSTSLLSSGRKLRNFFGQRPPSELIATHLLEYFPKAEKNKLLSKQVRQSMRKSMVRRDSQSSVLGGTSWEKAPDRYSLTPSAMSRFSGSSGGSSGQLPTGVENEATPVARPGGPRSSNGSGRSSAPPSVVLEPMDEGAEDDTGDEDDLKADARSVASSRFTRRMSRMSGGSRLSAWDRRSKDSDSASVITVDEVTAELETRRASMASWTGSDDDEDGMRPPSIELSIEDDDEFDDEETDEETSDEEEAEELTAEATLSKPPLKWIKGALIGAGSFGSVFLGMNPTSGSLMAVKQVELPTGNSHNEERKKSMLEALEREIELLKELQHDNIVQYLDSSSDGTHLNIFLEYVPGGSVAALLSNYGAFEEALVSKFVRQILTGLEYLHEREIIHRDIKGANILVDNKGGIKISDFGISKRVEDNLLSGSKVHRPSLQGSVYWMAPEVVKQTAYTSKADIWSLGCLVVEMLTGAHPWANLTQMQAIFRIGQSACPTIPDDISTDADDFLEQTFLIDYEDRPAARDLLAHAFIRDPESFAASQQTPTRATFSQNNSPVKADAV